MINKTELRKELLSKRLKLDQTMVIEKSVLIVDRLLRHSEYLKAKTIMAYIPIKNEVNIKRLIEQAWKDQKQILLPKVDPVNKRMEVYPVVHWNELELGNFQIPEPKIGVIPPFPIADIDVVLIPGVSFDQDGFRLGYGGGYYDRFFDRFDVLPYRIGIAFDMQIVDKLPVEQHDYPVNEVITEKNEVGES